MGKVKGEENKTDKYAVSLIYFCPFHVCMKTFSLRISPKIWCDDL